MNKSESKYLNTARLMDAALLSLLETKSYEYITVKAICEKAGVNRSTFYLHYETMNDLLLESVESVLCQMQNRFDQDCRIDRKQIASCKREELLLVTPKYLLPYLEFVKENKKLFLAVSSQPVAFNVNATFHKMYDEIFEPILERFHINGRDRQYQLAFYLNGMYAVIQAWVKGGCMDETEYICDLLIKCIMEGRNE